MAIPDIDLSHAAWRKSSYSNNGGACVEVATNLRGLVAVPDLAQISAHRHGAGRCKWPGLGVMLPLGAAHLLMPCRGGRMDVSA